MIATLKIQTKSILLRQYWIKVVFRAGWNMDAKNMLQTFKAANIPESKSHALKRK